MFEHGPWKDCSACGGKSTLGVLAVAGKRLQRRCKYCREGVTERLPELDKRVIYLDQNAMSETYKVAAGIRRAGAAHEKFWTDLNSQVQRLVLLQQAIFPDSDLHSSETIVFRDAGALREAMRRIGGGVSFANSDDVDRRQQWAYADAYMAAGYPRPVLDFSVDRVLVGDRNAWLPVISMHANPDMARFAEGLRQDRAKIDEAMRGMVEQWNREKPAFADVLAEELAACGQKHRRGYVGALVRYQQAALAGDLTGVLNAAHNPMILKQMDLSIKFGQLGFNASDSLLLTFDFWDWPILQEQPVHRISAYLFAAMARKAANGQKGFSRGMTSDVTAIATYAPYVDAMFVDNECAALLGEKPLRDDLKFKAKIFSLNSADAFLRYLADMEATTPAAVRDFAEHIYGLKKA